MPSSVLTAAAPKRYSIALPGCIRSSCKGEKMGHQNMQPVIRKHMCSVMCMAVVAFAAL